MMRFAQTLLLLLLVALDDKLTSSFIIHPSARCAPQYPLNTLSSQLLPLFAASDGASGEKRRRRRRKQPPVPQSGRANSGSSPPVIPDPVKTSLPEMDQMEDDDDDFNDVDEEDLNAPADTLAELAGVAKFKFQPKSGEDLSMPNIDVLPSKQQVEPATSPVAPDDVIPLPDIREARKKKALEEEEKRAAEEESKKRVKIKRGDTKALRDLFERQPFADADDSYFEEEEYGTVSALLAERTKPFLGIPQGPLQVGHFIGALVIILMAFIQYPGFPLTNLPSPVRDALQGGLGFVYAINALLAVQATFKAAERGQSKILWAMKTFSVGGLAVDQLSQLPTLEEMERAKSAEYKRAQKNKKKR